MDAKVNEMCRKHGIKARHQRTACCKFSDVMESFPSDLRQLHDKSAALALMHHVLKHAIDRERIQPICMNTA